MRLATKTLLFLAALLMAACAPVQTEGAAAAASIAIVAPEDGAQFQVGEAIEILSTFSDPGGGLSVILNVDPGLTRQDVFTSPVVDGNANQLWLAEAPGNYVVQVFLNTADGETIGSQQVHITVGEVTATAEPTAEESTPTATPLPPTVIAEEPANCRFGPSLAFQAVDALEGGQRAAVSGRLADDSWWLVATEGGASCWVFADNFETLGDFSQVPVVSAPPTPTPTSLPLDAPAAQSPSGSVGCVSTVFLTWGAVNHPDGIDHYEWEVSGAASDSGSTNGSPVEYFVACASSYSWRVRAVSNSGQVGPWSGELNFDTN